MVAELAHGRVLPVCRQAGRCITVLQFLDQVRDQLSQRVLFHKFLLICAQLVKGDLSPAFLRGADCR